ncbi:hypothetical protein [Salinibaculum salinum]|uniref:hypothetical protein n=1 Tax=Salinibaculum salinum TaxID=3131996 RepID=UPI0030EE0829
MATGESDFDVPRWVAGVVLVLVAVFVYAVVIGGSLTAPVAIALGALELAIALFVVYLLYRFVLAVETIAEKL